MSTFARLQLLVCAAALALAAPAAAQAQDPPQQTPPPADQAPPVPAAQPPALADLYPAVVPDDPVPPSQGPVPDIQSVPGQDPTPDVPRGCEPATIATGVSGVDNQGADPNAPNPLRGLRWYVDPMEHAYESYASYVHRGKQHEAELMWKIAREPKFRWFGRWTRPDLKKKVHEYLNCAAAVQPGAIPLMGVMRHQGNRCNPTYTAGGPAEDRRTQKWYDDFAAALGDARVIIAFEPDSLGTVDCLARSRQQSRLDNLRHGIDVLSKLPNVTLYIEAGASDWEPAKRTAKQLRYVGISKVRGFMLNATHYDWTAENIQHGLEISRLTGGKHFIVNTAENGRGPVHVRNWINRSKHIWSTINVWCHPLLRGAGPRPSTITANPRVDAYMWINRPGYSGGSCNGGPLPVGTWWPVRALMFASWETSWLRPPAGTSNGHHKRYSLRQLGYAARR
jgi:endoglucanase